MIEVSRHGSLTINLPGLYLESYKNCFYADLKYALTIQFVSRPSRYAEIKFGSRKMDIHITWSH